MSNVPTRLKTLCRNVFSSGQGKELLELLEEVYVHGKLYQEDDRATVYAIAQRDFVLEMKANLTSKTGEEIDG